jgi:hypothetical protein
LMVARRTLRNLIVTIIIGKNIKFELNTLSNKKANNLLYLHQCLPLFFLAPP